MKFEELQPDYEALWASMELKPSMAKSVEFYAAKIVSGRSRYEAVSEKTGVPWFVIGLIHMLEAGAEFSRHLHNGDPLTSKTVNVPKGRPAGKGPWTWEESAIDAIVYDKLDKVTEWSLPRIAYCLESFNGWGYRKYHPEVANPYLWSGCTHYARGKYVEDPPGSATRWVADLESKQVGAMPVLRRLSVMIPEIGLGSVSSIKPPPPPAPVPITPDSYRKAAPTPIKDALKGRTILGILIVLFGKLVTWLSDAAETIAQVGLDTIHQITRLEPLKAIAPKAIYMGGAITILGAMIAVTARISAARKGKIG
jgi:lysozyme family protein